MSSDLKRRKPNWGETEMLYLAEGVFDKLSILRSKFSLTANITSSRKTTIWQQITERVNTVSINCIRTVEEVKKRWQDAQSSVKKKEAARLRSQSGTGGGPQPENVFKPWELIVLQTLSPVAIQGIDGAVDTGALQSSLASCVTYSEDPDQSYEVQLTGFSEIDNPKPSTSSYVAEVAERSFYIQADETPCMPESSQCENALQNKDAKLGKISQKKRTNEDDISQLLRLKTKKVESLEKYQEECLNLKRRKVEALETIARCLTLQCQSQNQDKKSDFSVSPVISFL